MYSEWVNPRGLKYLERDAREVIMQKNAMKLVEPADAEAIAGEITELDFGVLEMTTTLHKLANQISKIELWTCSDHRGIEDAISLGNDLAASSAGVPDAGDDELKGELEMPIEEQKMEWGAEKEHVGLEEKRR